MKILRAEHLGMCFGVRDAISMAKEAGAKRPVTILGELVHNETVLNDLRQAGIQIEPELQSVTTAAVMITAHGASNHKLDAVRAGGFELMEGTCPLVKFAHRSLSKLVGEGCHPVIIGKRDHVEVKGMTEDFTCYDVVLTEEEIERIVPRAKFGVIAQTTQPIDVVRRLVAALRDHFPKAEVRFVDTVCQPTKQRQSAATQLAQQASVVVVIGGANSNNTSQLVSTCRAHCPHVYHVQNATGLNRDWFKNSDVVGITAGTSTPDRVIEEVEGRLQSFFA